MSQLSRNIRPVHPTAADSGSPSGHMVAAIVVRPENWFGFCGKTAVSDWLHSTLQQQFPDIPIVKSACVELLVGFDVRLPHIQMKVGGLLAHLVAKSGYEEQEVEITAVSQTDTYYLIAVKPYSGGKVDDILRS